MEPSSACSRGGRLNHSANEAVTGPGTGTRAECVPAPGWPEGTEEGVSGGGEADGGEGEGEGGGFVLPVSGTLCVERQK